MTREDLETELGKYERAGVIDLNRIVHDARRKTHALHDQFEWNDAKIAHQHRLFQAAGLVRRVVQVEQIDDTTMRVVRTFISKPEDRFKKPHLYTRRAIVVKDETDRLDHLIDVLSRALGNLKNAGAREIEPLIQMTEQTLYSLQRQRSDLVNPIAA
jgi:hypothetical protein